MGTGAPTPPSMTVDTQGETVILQFVDDKGNVAEAPAGAAVTFVSSDSTVLTVANNATNPFQGDLTPAGAAGTVTISATVSGANDASGNPLPNPDPVTVAVNPGAAAGERLTVQAPAATSAPAPTQPAPAPSGGGTTTNATDTTQLAQTVYETTNAAGSFDAASWPPSGYQDPNGNLLYYYSGDTVAGDQNGAGFPGWSVYQGAISPAPAAA